MRFDDNFQEFLLNIPEICVGDEIMYIPSDSMEEFLGLVVWKNFRTENTALVDIGNRLVTITNKSFFYKTGNTIWNMTTDAVKSVKASWKQS